LEFGWFDRRRLAFSGVCSSALPIYPWYQVEFYSPPTNTQARTDELVDEGFLQGTADGSMNVLHQFFVIYRFGRTYRRRTRWGALIAAFKSVVGKGQSNR
jgi:hypothetical protein